MKKETLRQTQGKVAILGFAREGKSILKHLKASKKHKNADIWILDKKKISPLPRGAHTQSGKQYLKNLDAFDVVFRSPGIPYLTAEIQRAKKKGVLISSPTKLFFEEIEKLKKRPKTVRRSSPQVIGVTGTKGKSTVATLLYRILNASGKKVVLAGNVGNPMLDILEKAKKVNYVILELSSFQLQDLDISPDIAIVLDIFPDHLDHHKNFKEYVDAKTNIARFQKKSDRVFYFSYNSYSKKIALASSGQKIGIRSKKGLEKNYDMTNTVARSLKCPKRIIENEIQSFKGLVHRLEFVRAIPYSGVLKNIGIPFYNDSAATNPQATAAALTSFKKPLILIAGGQDKKLNYSPLAKAIKKNVQGIVLFGENKYKISRALKRHRKRVVFEKNMQSATKAAYRISKSLITNHQLPVTILFSPASASFDMFKNYSERGVKFKKIVRGLK